MRVSDPVRLLVVAAAAMASVATTYKPRPRSPSISVDCGAIRVDLVKWTAERLVVVLSARDRGCVIPIVAARAGVAEGPRAAIDPPAAVDTQGATLTFPGFSPSTPGVLDVQLDPSIAWRMPLRDGALGDPVRISPIVPPTD